MPGVSHPTRLEGSDPSPSGARAADPAGPHPANGHLRVVRSPDPERWSSFVEAHPDASVFHTPEMHRVFSEARGHRSQVWAAVDRGGAIRALLPVVSIATMGGPARALTSRNVAFAGPLLDGDQAALRALLAVYRRAAPPGLFTEVRHVVDPGSAAGELAAAGFRHERHLNYLIDLTVDEDELWRAVASSARRNVQKARRMGVRVEQAETARGIEEAYPVLNRVYRRIAVPLPDRSLFEAAARILDPLGRFAVLLARQDGDTIGALTLLFHRDVATYWYTGTLREAWSSRPGDLLVAEAIATARARGARVFDFGGAGRPDEPYGVRDFKRKYGGHLVDFGRDVLVPSSVRLRLATAGYRLVRRFL